MSKELEKLKQKKAQLEARIQKEENKEKSKKRKDDTRRKILIGAVVMERMKKDDALSEQVKKMLAEKLTRANDRKLFELPPFEKSGK